MQHPRPSAKGSKEKPQEGNRSRAVGSHAPRKLLPAVGLGQVSACACMHTRGLCDACVCARVCASWREVKHGQVRSRDPRLSHEDTEAVGLGGRTPSAWWRQRRGQVAWAVPHPHPGHPGTFLIPTSTLSTHDHRADPPGVYQKHLLRSICFI